MAMQAEQDRKQEAYRRERAAQGKPLHRKIPGIISHNDALYFAAASGGGWTHTDRYQVDEEREAEARRAGVTIDPAAGHGEAQEVVVNDGSRGSRRSWNGKYSGFGEAQGEEGKGEIQGRRDDEEATAGKKSFRKRVSETLFGSKGMRKNGILFQPGTGSMG